MADADPALRPARPRALADPRRGSASSPARYAVATVHREANVTQPERLRRIVEGLRRVDGPVVFPAHPRTRAAIAALGPRDPD